MALTGFLILSKPLSGFLEERTALIQLIVNAFTLAFARMTNDLLKRRASLSVSL
jgi:hypothetical protein